MLHESPQCHGIVHDPELVTTYGTVYFALDGFHQELIRFDFSQPHGPGLMDHSTAQVRRYSEIKFTQPSSGVHVHQGMVIDSQRRVLYLASPGEGAVKRVWIDTGEYARTARETYPIFSSRLPSFEYSIYECVVHDTFADGLGTPSGLALDAASDLLYVGDWATGDVAVFDTSSKQKLRVFTTVSGAGGAGGAGGSGSGRGLSGLAFAPNSGGLYGVNELSQELLKFSPQATSACDSSSAAIFNPGYTAPPAASGDTGAAASSQTCTPKPEGLPSSTLFEQVHTTTGYASEDDRVQNDNSMDTSAALLATRTDCAHDSEVS